MKISQADLAEELGIPARSVRLLLNRFHAMKSRCYNPDNSFFDRYGGRGISVCDAWLVDSFSFCRWAIQSGFKPHLQIDRINNDGNYCPENCRWVTQQENLRNRKTTNRMIESASRSIRLVDQGFRLFRFREVWEKPVRCVETNKLYVSQKQASLDTHISESCISNALSGLNKTAGGFHWERV